MPSVDGRTNILPPLNSNMNRMAYDSVDQD